MSSFNLLPLADYLVILASPELGSSLWKGSGFVFAVFGAWVISLALFPQYKSVYFSKNTVGVNKPMFLFHTLVALLFFAGGVFMVIATFLDSDGSTKCCYFSTLTGIVFSLLNFFAFLGNGYVASLKLFHFRSAKRLGVSEVDYYAENVLPSLRDKSE